MIEILPPRGKYKYDTWRILPVKCYIDNFVHLQSCIRNIKNNIDKNKVLVCYPNLDQILAGLSSSTIKYPNDSTLWGYQEIINQS
jgi:hypothetical protein